MTTETETRTVGSLAAELSHALERKQRDPGNHDPGLDHYTALRDGSPDWMTDACYAAHQDGSEGGMMPDDWRYEFIEDAAGALAECDGDYESAREYLDETDSYMYTHQQTGWLHSRADRTGYVDQARSEFGDSEDTWRQIAMGMRCEQMEVLDTLYGFLEEMADEEDDD